jgi:hypothetical protein
VGKVIFWLVVVFIVLFALRLINASKHRARNGERAGRASEVGAMARCVDCGVYLPSVDATAGPRGPLCGDAKCLERAGIGSRKPRD